MPYRLQREILTFVLFAEDGTRLPFTVYHNEVAEVVHADGIASPDPDLEPVIVKMRSKASGTIESYAAFRPKIKPHPRSIRFR